MIDAGSTSSLVGCELDGLLGCLLDSDEFGVEFILMKFEFFYNIIIAIHSIIQQTTNYGQGASSDRSHCFGASSTLSRLAFNDRDGIAYFTVPASLTRWL